MKLRYIVTSLAFLGLSGVVVADLEPWEDYDIGSSVMNVTTVKVDSNMIDAYLEGLSKSWMVGNERAKELGQIQDYGIYVSELPNSGDFNVVLVVTFADSADLQPNKEDYDEFMSGWSDAQEEVTDEQVQMYPSIRKITGEYLMREITLK
jgi:hypothetical protein